VAAATPFNQAKELSNQLMSILSQVDIDTVSREERTLVVSIKRQLEDVRLDARDYDFAETRAEQQQNAAGAKKSLETLQAMVLKASEYNIFGAVDVAHASARIQQLISNLE
jgi:hypothetical protein